MGAALVTLSFALMFVLPLLPVHAQLALIALSAIGFDLACSQAWWRIRTWYMALTQARGRLNALLFTVVFIGMSLGSVLGSKAVRAGRLERSGHAGSDHWRASPGDPPAGECLHPRCRTQRIIKPRFA